MKTCIEVPSNICKLAPVLLLVLLAAPRSFAVTNGGFESALSGWTTQGSATTVATFGGLPAPAGSSMLMLTSGGAPAATLETALGISPGGIDAIVNGTPTVGAIAYQSFTLATAGILSFSWNFLDAEGPAGYAGTFKDAAFYSLNGSAVFLADVDSIQGSVTSGTPMYQHNGFQSQSLSLSAGTYSFGFGVIDEQDTGVNSILLVDNIVLTLPGFFRAGINANGGIGIQNLSNPGLSINTITISLTNGTFFDTTNTSPGTASTGWSQQAATGGATAALPTNALTDGLTFATINLTGMDPGDAINLGFDLDLFASPDGSGNPLGTIVTATFSNGSTASLTLAQQNATINGTTYSYSGTSDPSAVPEPSSALLVALGAGAIWFFRRRPVRC